MSKSFCQTVVVACGFMLVGGVAATVLTGQKPAIAQEDAKVAPLRHVVLFKFKAEATKEQIRVVTDAFAALPKKIDAVSGFEWGTDVSPEGLAQGFTHCFVVTFKDSKARDIYLPHAAHKAFVEVALPKVEKVLVVDYVAQK